MMLIQVIDITSLLTLMTICVGNATGYKILGLFPYQGKSHFMMFTSLMKGLAEKGHSVHVVSHYPLDTPVVNYTDLSVAGSVPLHDGRISLKQFERSSFDLFTVLKTVKNLYRNIQMHEGVMKSDTIHRLMESQERYDLIITESFTIDVTLGFVDKFQVPFIFLSTCSMPPWTSSLVANPQNPAYVPNFLLRYSPLMTFTERLWNTLGLTINLAGWYWFHVSENQRLMNKYFETDVPPLLDIAKNVSLVLLNTHSSIMGSRPFAPNVIEVGGIHIEPPRQLPKDIEHFLESSPQGVIYFCLGSTIRTATLPEKKRNAFMFAFSQLKERVLWKFEEETIDTNENIMIRKWMPQRDILAHPKVKLFISHCGLMGILEAASAGKPILGIPLAGDQWTNCRALEFKGLAKLVTYRTIDNESILKALQEVLQPEYVERAKQISKIFHDRPMTPMDTAIYWVEYVIRNKGAKHLRTSAVDLPFYQYLLLDVVAFIIFCVSATSYIIYYILKSVIVNRKALKVVKAKLR